MAAMDRNVSVGISYMYEPVFNRAIVPLLESGDVDALEWSFDTVSDHDKLPGWTRSLLRAFSDEDRLYGHGVYYSLLTGTWGPRQELWLDRLRRLQHDYSFRHISEHFGFMTSRHAHKGAPLPVPMSEASLSLGRSRLAALCTVSKGPVGVENLALAFTEKDVLSQGTFLRELVEPVGGFIVLDLHNLYCQSANFGIDLHALILSYPLERVREVHLSGGSWADSDHRAGPVRRDTHDDVIPEMLLSLLPFVIARCPNLDVIFIERLGDTFPARESEALFRAQFLSIKTIVAEAGQHAVSGWPFPPHMPAGNALSDAALFGEQQDILGILATAASAPEAKASLMRHPTLGGSNWRPEQWDLAMLDTAMQIGRKWGIDREELP
jgi:uncharacterized protein (UPF0276 family)